MDGVPTVPPDTQSTPPEVFHENRFDQIKARKRNSTVAFQHKQKLYCQRNERKPKLTHKQSQQAMAKALRKKAALTPPSNKDSSNEAPSNKDPSNEAPSNEDPSNEDPSNEDPSNEAPSNEDSPNNAPSNEDPSNEANSNDDLSNNAPSNEALTNADAELPEPSDSEPQLPGPTSSATELPESANTSPGSSNDTTQSPETTDVQGPAPKKPRRAYSRKGAESNVDKIPQRRAQRNPPGDYRNKAFYFSRLIKKRNMYVRRRGSPEFMKDFLEGEKLHFSNGKKIIVRHSNGIDYENKIGVFNVAALFENKEGLGIKVPDDLDFNNILDYIDPEKMVNIAYSDKKAVITMTMRQLMEKFKVDAAERPDTLNMISLEFTRDSQKLQQEFKVPDFVEKKSIVQLVETALKKKLQELEEKLHAEMTDEERKDIEMKKKGFLREIELLPRYEKFLLVSMAGSFTDVHIDFSSTCVFYHVKKGKKIFYVAKLTPETWKIYQEFEKDTSKGKMEWIGEKLSGEWERVEIGEGETAMIPSGYIHFVYTPVDSLVIGGNFLMEQSLRTQFDLTELEEWCVVHTKHIEKGQMMEGFRGLMWGYMKHVLTPRLAENPESEFLNEAAHICLEKMKRPVAGFPKHKIDEIVKELRDLMTLPKQPPHGPTVDPISAQ